MQVDTTFTNNLRYPHFQVHEYITNSKRTWVDERKAGETNGHED